MRNLLFAFLIVFVCSLIPRATYALDCDVGGNCAVKVVNGQSLACTCAGSCCGNVCQAGTVSCQPLPTLTPTPPVVCPYPNLAIQVSADGTTWGSSADTIRGANGYTKRYYRIMSGETSIQNALATAPVTIKWEKTATTGGSAVRVLNTYVTTATNTSLAHNSDICAWVDSGKYFMCQTITSDRTQNIGDAGDFKFTVSSPACTASVAAYKITTATQATSCPSQGIRLEYSSDKITWRQYGQYFSSNTGSSSQMCARVVDVASGAVLDRDYLEERWWAPPPPSSFTDSNASSTTSTNALSGGWVPWKNNQSVYDTSCWTPTAQRTAGLWTGEARYYGLNTCASKATSAVGTAATCRENNPPIFKIFGDADGDCEVDLIHDFVIFIREKMGILKTKDADFNGSGTVDSSDFAIWKIGYQTFQKR